MENFCLVCRFAGDDLLPRGRYYTIAADASGNDGGTGAATAATCNTHGRCGCARELRAYYNPLKAGIVQIFDTTNPPDRKALSRFNLPVPGLVLVFLPAGPSPNPFAKRQRRGVDCNRLPED
jgi:hypothetical protein